MNTEAKRQYYESPERKARLEQRLADGSTRPLEDRISYFHASSRNVWVAKIPKPSERNRYSILNFILEQRFGPLKFNKFDPNQFFISALGETPQEAKENLFLRIKEECVAGAE